MRFSKYVEIREEERRATIGALLNEIDELKEQLRILTQKIKAEKKSMVPYQETHIGFKGG